MRPKIPLTRREFEGKFFASTPTVTIGRHDFPCEHSEWGRVHTLGPSPIMAFSRAPIEVTFGLDAPVILTGAVAATPPAGSGYVRSPRSRAGHRVVWCSFNDDRDLSQIVGGHDPGAQDRPGSPFQRCATPSSPLAAATARRAAAAALDRADACDPLELDEAVVRIAELVVRGNATPGDRRTGGATHRERRAAVNAACETMALRYDERLSLGTIAEETPLSPAFLSRVFLEHTGVTMHAYLTLVRLAEAVHLLRDSRVTIARAAIACGFSSHSHLTSTCTARLGVRPSDIAHATRSERDALAAMLRLGA